MEFFARFSSPCFSVFLSPLLRLCLCSWFVLSVFLRMIQHICYWPSCAVEGLLRAERSTRQGVDRGFLYCARSQCGENRSLATVLLVPDVLTRLRGALAPARDRPEAPLRTHIHRRGVPLGALGSDRK